MIDRVIYSAKDKVVALKNVTMNENYFQGHFQEEKIMPGVLIIEAMAQAGIVLVNNVHPKTKKAMYYLGTVNKTKFSQPVRPGDQLRIEVTPIKILSKASIIHAEAFLDKKKVAQADLSFSVKEIE